jgi:pyruvate-ferredoxin/flavodoxin oxidoreductase
LNVHCGHDDIYGALDTGWIMLFGKDAQQAADQALILRRVTELSLTPGMNIMDGFLTTHLERTFYKHESELIREYLGAPDDIIDCPTPAQRTLFGPTRRRVPKMMDLANPVLLGPVQNQEHYMNGVVARRNNFTEPILEFLEAAYKDFGELTGRKYGLLTEYKTEDADTVFVSLGSAAENIEAAVDYLRETRGVKVGSIHINVIRPFPEAAVVNALRGKKNVIILERTDEAMSPDNPLGKDIRTALSKAIKTEGRPSAEGLPSVSLNEVPTIFGGTYGLGSRDFRPEHVIGAYEFATGTRARKDGKKASDGVSFMVLGIDHPYSVVADETPSLLPEGAVAVRFHSIGGWGAITTGKNLGAILGDLNDLLYERDGLRDNLGNPKEVIHVSANPKYGSEKKGAPTSYFMVAAKDRIRVNCDLRHVTVVLCCDPKAFTHTNPLDGIQEGGSLVWESDADGERAWENLPLWARKQIIDKNIRVFTLPGFDIARKATDRADLQLRMQGNAFLGAFFAVSPMLQEFGITQEQFRDVVHKQYVKKFGKLGEAVVQSNMEVMLQGFERVKEIKVGALSAADHSTLRGQALMPILELATAGGSCGTGCRSTPVPAGQGPRAPIDSIAAFDAEFRSNFGYDQPATPLSAMGIIAAATGDTASKYVARRETPLYIPENCTQCMECISVCPDTALPNTSQDLGTLLSTAISYYVADGVERTKMLRALPEIEKQARTRMLADIKAGTPLPKILREVVEQVDGFSAASKEQFFRHHGEGSHGLPEGECHLLVAGAQGPRFGRHLLHLCFGSMQGLRSLRNSMRRARGVEDGSGNRAGKCRARDRHRLPRSAARHLAKVSRPLQQRQSCRLKDGHAAQHADGAHQLRRTGGRRRRLRGLRRKERAALDCRGDRGLHAPCVPRQERSLCGEGRRVGEDGRGEAGCAEGKERRRVRAVAPGDSSPGDGPGRRRRQGHQGAHRGLRGSEWHRDRRAACGGDCGSAAD